MADERYNLRQSSEAGPVQWACPQAAVRQKTDDAPAHQEEIIENSFSIVSYK